MNKEKKSVQKVKRVKEVVYPILQECCKHFKDEFWIKLFDDLSRGRCPKGVNIFKDVISSTYKRNGFAYTFIGEHITAEQIVQDLPELLKNSLCIYSQKDIVNKKSDIHQAKNEYMNVKASDDWKKIKNRKMKENLITNYAINMKKKYKLTLPNTKALFNIVKDCLLNKTHGHKSDDVKMEDGEILKIVDIEYNKKTKAFVNLREENIDVKEKEKVDYLNNKWEHYVAQIIKELIKNN